MLSAVPVVRAPGVKPLWLRMEWNLVDATELTRFIREVSLGNREARSGVKLDLG